MLPGPGPKSLPFNKLGRPRTFTLSFRLEV